MTRDAELYRFNIEMGDHAAVMCSALKGVLGLTDLKQPWISILRHLNDEKRLVTDWKASSADLPEPDTPFTDDLEASVAALVAGGLADLDFDLALFAIRTYARRNALCHGRTEDLSKSGKFANLAEYLPRFG